MGARWWTQARGTIGLVGLLAAVYAAEVALEAPGDARLLMKMGAFPNSAVVEGQWWRIFTCAFLHLSWWHLVANLALLGWAGHAVESRLGTARWAAVAVAGLIVPGAMLLLVRTVSPAEGVTAGATAVACALLAAAVVLLRRRRRRRAGARLWIAAAGAAVAFFLPGLTLLGHASGLLTGALLATIFAGI
ncbi:MAG TPA: rhomboid family intramembrane serine protease [Vicinamibacteria bacterium]|nr:rhomboid family intramembrane serine protease [Vicinamibacteria bacterium]